jgi:two-component system response regulator RstA
MVSTNFAEHIMATMSSLSEFRVLLVEDDAELASMVADFLTPQGFDVAIEGRGDRAVERITTEVPDIVILDVNLPGLDGFSVCRAVRADFAGPILILTARGDEIDEVVGLEVGADDYMSKPVRPRVLLARLRAHLRKATPVKSDSPEQQIQVGSLFIDASRRAVELAGKPVELTTAEFDLLWLMAENTGQVLSRNDIYEKIHGFKYDGFDRSIDLRISRLRKKLGDDTSNPQRIKSVRGVGYILSAESCHDSSSNSMSAC